MKVLFFASSDCDKCKALLKSMKNVGIPKKASLFMYIDAFADDQQVLCDEHDIDELPRVKVFDEKKGLIFDKVGSFDVQSIVGLFKA